MGRQPFFNQIRVSQMVSGIRKNGIQYHLAGNAMIAMPDISSIGIGGDDNLRLVLSDKANNLLSELGSVFQTLVRKA